MPFIIIIRTQVQNAVEVKISGHVTNDGDGSDFFSPGLFAVCAQEHRTEIDARAGTFQAFELLGQQLLQNQHYASDDVQEKLEELAKAREELEQ